jgi:microcystin-dependent protein
MSDPFLAEIRLFGFNFAPRGWALCDGQILPINQNQSLYSLLGTTYGGDGRTSFGLPDLRGRVPIHVGHYSGGTPHDLGDSGGEEVHALTQAEIPEHTHEVRATTENGPIPQPGGSLPASFNNGYVGASVDPATLVPLREPALGQGGGGSSVDNNQPSLVVAFAIALTGVFPSRN